MNNEIQDKLRTPLYSSENFIFNWWSLSHFLLFTFIGFIKPGYIGTFFTAGVLFEIFEDCMSSDDTTQLIDCKKEKNSFCGNILCNGYNDSYWYSKSDDIIINLIGYITGQTMSHLYN
jgi:hypothetical protein